MCCPDNRDEHAFTSARDAQERFVILRSALALASRGKLSILIFHRVLEAFRSTTESSLDLTMFGLKKYVIGTVEERRAAIGEVLDELKYLPLPQRNRRAKDILRIAGVAPPNELMLTQESLRSLSTFGIDVGAHTVRHPILAKASLDDAWQEISEGKRALEKLLGQTVTVFAYPNGKPGHDYMSEHVRMVRDAGFAAAVNTVWSAASRTSDPFQLPRFTP